MEDFILIDNKRITLENSGNTLLAKIYDENGEYIDEVSWDIDSLANILFTK